MIDCETKNKQLREDKLAGGMATFVGRVLETHEHKST